MQKLRIAMIAACPCPWPRGTPVRIHRISEALAALGHEVHLATYHLGKKLENDGIHVHRIPDVPSYKRTSPGPSFKKLAKLDPMLVRLVRALHEKIDFDVVHAHHYEGVIVASLASKHVPIVYDAHTTLAGELPQYNIGLPDIIKASIGSFLDRRLPKCAQRTIAVTKSIRDNLVRIGAVPANKIHVVTNGVEWEQFNPPKTKVVGEPIAIFTGNTSPYQRVDLLLEAFAVLLESHPDARLQIVTDDRFDQFRPLNERLGILDKIDLINAPFVEQRSLLSNATVAVSPRTECDGIPQKLLNYMAAGTPVVAFEGSAVHIENGRTGLRIPNEDVRAMARAIASLIDNRELAAQIGANARKLIIEEYSWEKAAREIEKVYQETLSENKKGRNS